MFSADKNLQELALDRVKLTNEQVELQSLEELQRSLITVNNGLDGAVFISVRFNYQEHLVEPDKHRLLEIKNLILRRIKDKECREMQENINSYGQKGGVTAHTVNIGTSPATPHPDKPKPLWKKIISWVVAIAAFLASIAAILEYADVKPQPKKEAKAVIIKEEPKPKSQKSKEQ